MTYKQLIHMEPEEVDADSRLQYIAGYILDLLRQKGVYDGPRSLDTDETVWVKTKLLRHPDGLWQFSDETIEMAIMYMLAAHVSLGHKPTLDVSKVIRTLKGE